MEPVLRPLDPRIRKVLVVDLGVLGDTVHLLPALWDLRANFPDAALHVATSPAGAALLGLTSAVDRVWPLEQDPARRSRREQWAAFRAWRRERFDAAITFSGADRAVLTTALSGARLRLAHDAGRRHFYNRWLIRHWIPRQPRDLPVYEQRRRVLAAAGLRNGEVKFGLRAPPDASAWAAERLPAGGVHVSLNASSPYKEWPVGSWAALVRLLAGRFPAVAATAGAGERERRRLDELEAALPEVRLPDLRDTASLGRLVAVLQRCAGHIGGDSGVTHLAMALALPTVALFRDYDGRVEWSPPGARHRQLVRSCGCLRGPNAACAGAGTALCLAQIPPEDVAAAAMEVFAASAPPGRQ